MPFFPDPRPSFRSVGLHESGAFNPQEALPRYYKDHAPLPAAPFHFIEYVWPGLTTVQIEQVRSFLGAHPGAVTGWDDPELPQVKAVRFFQDFIVRVCAPGTGGHTFMVYAEVVE
jgi:hypothetical protein